MHSIAHSPGRVGGWPAEGFEKRGLALSFRAVYCPCVRARRPINDVLDVFLGEPGAKAFDYVADVPGLRPEAALASSLLYHERLRLFDRTRDILYVDVYWLVARAFNLRDKLPERGLGHVVKNAPDAAASRFWRFSDLRRSHSSGSTCRRRSHRRRLSEQGEGSLRRRDPGAYCDSGAEYCSWSRIGR